MEVGHKYGSGSAGLSLMSREAPVSEKLEGLSLKNDVKISVLLRSPPLLKD